jgi:hypothetical protein
MAAQRVESYRKLVNHTPPSTTTINKPPQVTMRGLCSHQVILFVVLGLTRLRETHGFVLNTVARSSWSKLLLSIKSDLSFGSRAVVDHDRETRHYVPHLTRRQALRSSLLSVVVSSLPFSFSPEPAAAAYIDPAANPPKITQRVYIDVVIGDKATAVPQRIVMGLYGDDMPRTVDNFVALVKDNGYAGTTFYRVLYASRRAMESVQHPS